MNDAAIATPHRLATEAGWHALQRGGSAVDAAIASAAVLSVIYPHDCSIGGDLVALVKEPSRGPECFIGVGRAPRDTQLEAAVGRFGPVMPARGPATLTVPGAPAGWQQLHARYGRLAPSVLLESAVALADSYEISRSVSLGAAKAHAAGGYGADVVRTLFGSSYEIGRRVSNPALGETLERMGSHGFMEFYEGRTAESLLAFMQSHRPEFGQRDFECVDPVITTPASYRRGTCTVHTSPPPTQGFGLLRLVEQLAHDGDNDVDSPRVVDALHANARKCNHLRDHVLSDTADPYFYRDDAWNDWPAPATSGRASSHADGDTIGISCQDSTGLSVSWVQSLYLGFGSYLMDPGTGVLLQCRGGMFTLDTTRPNALRAGAMPPHTLMPVIVTDEKDRTRYIQSTKGGKSQAQIHAQVLLRQLNGETPRSALLGPRWMVTDDVDGEITIMEESVAPRTREHLTAASPRCQVDPDFTDRLGHMQLVSIDPDGHPVAASDPRSDGSARSGPLTCP